MTVVNTSIIAGTEDILEEAAELHKKNIAHEMYVQLANEIRIDGIRPHPLALQEAQLKVRSKLIDAGEPVKSVVLQAWEAMPETSKELLSAYQSQARLARAKIEAFYGEGDNVGDGVIDYNDPAISSIADEILKNEDGKYDNFLYTEGYDPETKDADSVFDKEEQVFSGPKVRQLSKQQQMRRNMSKYRDGEGAENFKKFVKFAVNIPVNIIQEDLLAPQRTAFGYYRSSSRRKKRRNKRSKR